MDLLREHGIIGGVSGGDKTFNEVYQGVDLILAEVKTNEYVYGNRWTGINFRFSLETALTGGWVQGYTTTNANTSIEASWIQVQTTADASYYATLSTLNKFDMSNFSKIYFKYDAVSISSADNGRIQLYIGTTTSSEAADTTYSIDVTVTKGTSFSATTVLDVSDVTDSQHILVSANQEKTTGKFYEIWGVDSQGNKTYFLSQAEQVFPPQDQTTSAIELQATVAGDLKPFEPTPFSIYFGFVSKEDKWQDSKFYFYKDGDEVTTLTGGWVGGYTYGSADIKEKLADQIHIKCDSTSREIYTYRTAIPIDVTGLSDIFVTWEKPIASSSYSKVCYALLTEANKNNDPVYNAVGSITRTSGSFPVETDSIDVRSFTGLHYIAVSCQDAYSSNRAPSEMRAYRMWGE